MTVTTQNVRRIHEASMRILARTGMKFGHPDAQRVLKENGIRMEGDIAYFTEAQIMKFVGMAPSTFVMEASNHANDVIIGGDHVVRGVTIVTNIMERDGTIRDATIEDYLKIQKLYEANPKIGVNGGMTVDPIGIPPYWNDLVLNYASLMHSEKALYTAGGNYEQMEACIQMTRIRFGYTEAELKDHCILIGLSNPNSPLLGTDDMVETIFAFGKHRQAVVIAPAAMAGTTSPMTIAGTIATTNAEAIACVALAQMANPGTPVIMGSASTVADMRTAGIAIGAPESALCVKYSAQLAHFYGVPCRGGGTLTDAKAFNPQAAYEGTLVYTASREGGINLMLHSAGVLNGYLSMSWDKMILDFEIQDYVDRYFDDIEINAETIPEDLIDEIGCGGEYLTSDHTYDYMRIDPMLPHISARGTELDPDNFYKNIDRRIVELLEAYQKPEVPADRVAEMQEMLRKVGIEDSIIERCTI